MCKRPVSLFPKWVFINWFNCISFGNGKTHIGCTLTESFSHCSVWCIRCLHLHLWVVTSMLCFVLVLDPRGEVDVGEAELEDLEKQNQEMNSPNQVRQHMWLVIHFSSCRFKPVWCYSLWKDAFVRTFLDHSLSYDFSHRLFSWWSFCGKSYVAVLKISAFVFQWKNLKGFVASHGRVNDDRICIILGELSL